ncbi:L-Ala-D/L-amino acid epimerase-like [Pistacia vera]|uniref:L-Ala-D/L-amino acid epimerase-like n=1 Tax=Pistacia vera TaxID=55513 RepID=UPI0012630697|nr:L-Ala-D/L-amino acid epimerase-like [Pistacia vera]
MGALSSPISLFLFSPKQNNVPTNMQRHQRVIKFCVNNVMAKSTVSTTERTSFGFKNLTETFWVDVHGAEGRPLNVIVSEAINVGSESVEKVENVGVRIELSNGCVGWGEVAVVPLVGGDDQAKALVKVREACQFLRQTPPMTLNLALDEIAAILPGAEFASVRTGVEMALIDAVASSIDVPLWRLFGGVSNSLSTAITIPSVSPSETTELASKYCKLGFKTLKLKVGKDLNADIEVLQAIQTVHPHCSLILDANEGYSSKEAIEALGKLNDKGIIHFLFEQPVHRDDWKGLRDVNNVARDVYGINVIADESVKSLVDVQKVIKENLASVINIKLSKFGVMGTLEIVEVARLCGMKLMIDGMVETRLATGFAGHLAAGLGCFKYINLNSPLLLLEDPVVGGYEVSGAIYNFVNARGQGGFLKWSTISW